ncbi:hypothetical protein ACJIZ3_013457 [Penstemon smallii]|uniref:RBR-type E3 ubiquitin transferase n=1 Tax=Penstemon smallii TaxID=265156 RepID=A0ABD3UTF4_9LAMI
MAMEEELVLAYNVNLSATIEEDEEEFRSCCEDEDELKEREETIKVDLNGNVDENSIKMYFKGVSVAGPGDSGSRISGIGVVMERLGTDSPIQVQKKLDFYVEESVADYLALLDGLSVAIQNDIKQVLAFTDSQVLCDQITHDEELDNPLLFALRQRILEQTSNMENFVLKFLPASDLQKALKLAQVAVGIVSFPAEGEKATESCSICCEEKLSFMMLKIKCSHKFCSQCMKTYVEGKVQSNQVPIKCLQPKCKYCISTTECRSFLPLTSYESLEKALLEANILDSDKIYCPYSNCSVLLDPSECFSSDNSCVECSVCERFICVDCGVPWHSSMTCEEYRNLPFEERDASDLNMNRVAQNKRWRRCQQCRRMIELTHGCYHMTCWCGHEFCYSCGLEYRDSEQTCQCALWDEDYTEELASTYPTQQIEQWAWDSFDSLPVTMDTYSDQERSQLALIHRFLAGGFSLSDHIPYNQSPPRCTDSYVDVMKDLHQLPWLERFVSVISDNYYEEYVQ